MADVEISVEKGGTLKVVRHYYPRVLLIRRRRKNELQRRLVARWRSCRRSCSQDATFWLKGLFVFTLICGVIRIPYERFIPYTFYRFDRPGISQFYQTLWGGILFVATITTVSVLWLLTMKVKRTAPSWRKAELQSVSGLVQHL